MCIDIEDEFTDLKQKDQMLDYKMLELKTMLDKDKRQKQLDTKINNIESHSLKGLGRHWKAR